MSRICALSAPSVNSLTLRSDRRGMGGNLPGAFLARCGLRLGRAVAPEYGLAARNNQTISAAAFCISATIMIGCGAFGSIGVLTVSMRQWALFALKFAVSAALLYFATRRIQIDTIGERLNQLAPGWLIAGDRHRPVADRARRRPLAADRKPLRRGDAATAGAALRHDRGVLQSGAAVHGRRRRRPHRARRARRKRLAQGDLFGAARPLHRRAGAGD